MKKILFVILMLAMVLFSGSCREASVPDSSMVLDVDYVVGGYGEFYYFYDETHEVSIWIWYAYRAGGLAVLPGKDVSNPFEPMELINLGAEESDYK